MLVLGEVGLWATSRDSRHSHQRTRFGCEGEIPAPSQTGEPRAGPKGKQTMY